MNLLSSNCSPFTSGGKLGLSKAPKSYDEIFVTRFPLYKVWLKYKQHSIGQRRFCDQEGSRDFCKESLPGII